MKFRSKNAGQASKEWIDLVRNTLNSGRSFRFLVRGGSMRPFIRSVDIITLSPAANHAIRTGDIIAFIPTGGEKMIVHRVVLRHRSFFLPRGDNLIRDDG